MYAAANAARAAASSAVWLDLAAAAADSVLGQAAAATADARMCPVAAAASACTAADSDMIADYVEPASRRARTVGFLQLEALVEHSATCEGSYRQDHGALHGAMCSNSRCTSAWRAEAVNYWHLLELIGEDHATRPAEHLVTTRSQPKLVRTPVRQLEAQRFKSDELTGVSWDLRERPGESPSLGDGGGPEPSRVAAAAGVSLGSTALVLSQS